MEWEIALSRQAEKLLAKNHLPDEFVIVPVGKAIRKFSVNLNPFLWT